MNDDANPQGIERPRLAVKKVAQDDPKTSRPMLGVHKRNAGAGVDIRGNAWGRAATPSSRPSLPVGGGAATPSSRPSIPVAGEGNSPAGVQRPSLKLKTQDEIWANPQKPGAPYDQDLDPDDAEY